MPLLSDIIDGAIDNNSSLSALLRKCLLLAHELKNSELKAWANQELNGYSSNENLPDYRIISAGAKGHFMGSFHAEIRNYPIPAMALNENHRDLAEKVYLIQEVSAYESAVKNTDGTLEFEWPADFCLYYQRKLLKSYGLVRASQTIAIGSVVGMLDAIRNRTLNMALEIRSEIGDSVDFQKITSVESQKVSETVTQNIFNGPAYFASGEAQFTVSADNNRFQISIGKRDELDKVLLSSGVDRTSLGRLTNAIDSDGKTMGSKVKDWIKDTAPKVMAGGVKIGSAAAQSLLTEWLKQYFGV